MAKAVINLQKESGGIVKISPVDGTGVTEVTVPESGNLVSVDTAVTDNAIARYDGTTGKVQNSGVVIDDNNNVGIGTSSPSSFTNYGVLSINGTNGGISNYMVNNTETGRVQAYSGGFVITAKGANTNLAFETNSIERMRIDANGNVGIGVTPMAWTNSRVIQLGSYSSIHESTDSGAAFIGSNIYRSGQNISNYITSGWGAALYEQNGGYHKWYTAPSGTAGNPITWTNAMTLDTSGALTVQSTPTNGRINIGASNNYIYGNTVGTIIIGTAGSDKLTLDASGNILLTSGTGGLGYGTGAGGTVTQLTSKSTAVTLNKPCGSITMNNAALAAGAKVVFALNNSLITLGDLIHVTIVDHQKYSVEAGVGSVNGIAEIVLRNVSANTYSDAVVIRYTIIKGANA